MKLNTKELVTLALLSALLFVLQVALAFIPNIELVSILIMIYTLIYGKKTLYIIYTFALLQGLIYGFGIWWLMYLYVWTILFFVVSFLKKNQSVILWAIVAAIFGFTFGFLCSIPYFIMGGIGAGLAWWSTGISFDLIHGFGNFFIVLVLFKPLYSVIFALSKLSKSTND